MEAVGASEAMGAVDASAAVQALLAIFPNANREALRAVLAVTGGDVNAATNFVISAGLDEVEANLQHSGMAGAASEAAAASTAPAATPGAVQTDAPDSVAGSQDEDDEPHDEGEDGEDGEEEEEEEEADPQLMHESKRLRRVEASAPEALQGQATSLCQFDEDLVLRKSYIHLLNIAPSRTSHKSITLLSPATQCDPDGVKALLSGYARVGTAGWWVQRYPVAEADYVWRIVVNAHICSRSLGLVVHVCARSFAPMSGGEMEVRVLVSDCGDDAQVRKLGVSLLSIAPSAHGSSHILLHKQVAGKADGTYTLQDRAEFKLQRERGSAAEQDGAGGTAAGSKAGGTTGGGGGGSGAQATKKRSASGMPEEDRWMHRLYRPEGTGAPMRWVGVEEGGEQ